MKITRVEASIHSSTFEATFYKFWAGTRVHTKRDAVIYKVSTDEGIIGFGEGSCLREGVEHVKDIARAIVGEDPFNIEGIREKVARILPDEGTMNLAMAGIDVALYDIVGRTTGKSVCELLGGFKREKVRVYGSDLLFQSPEEYAKHALGFVEHGFKAIKFRPGIGPEGDIKALKAIRDAVGDDIEIMVDGGSAWCGSIDPMGSNVPGGFSYAPSTVRMLARECVKLNVYFLEEPFHREDMILYKDLKTKIPELRIAFGEREKTVSGFKELVENGIDILQPDVAYFGFTVSKEIAELAKKEDKLLIPHAWGTLLGQIANAQFAATLTEKEAPWCEYPVYTTAGLESMYPFPLAEEILTEPLEVKNSYIKIPQKLGLGVEVNERILEKYPYVPGPFTYYIFMPGLPILRNVETIK